MSVFLFKKPKCVFIHIPKTGGTSIRNNSLFKVEIRKNKVLPEWHQYFKFTFVRNPFDRAVSAWHHCCRGNKSFLEFLKIAVDDSVPYQKVTSEAENIKHHTLPQSHPFYCFDKADFVGCFETLQEDFDKICDQLNIKPFQLPHLNKTKHKHYSRYYDDQTFHIVNDYFKEDLQLFDYTFEKN